jgi:hypothetical protein
VVWSHSVKEAAARARRTTRPITTDEWVHRLNALARQMDTLCEGVHPSAWHELTEELRAEFRQLVQMPTQDPPEQLSLFDE